MSDKLKEYTVAGDLELLGSVKPEFCNSTISVDIDLAADLNNLSKRINVPVAKIIEQAARDITHH